MIDPVRHFHSRAVRRGLRSETLPGESTTLAASDKETTTTAGSSDTTEQSGEPSGSVDGSDIDWATVDVTTIDWASIDITITADYDKPSVLLSDLLTGETNGIVADYLVGTDVFVDHLCGARRFDPKSHRVHFSVVTRAELFAGNTASDAVTVVLASFREIEIDRTIAERAGRIRPAPGIRLPDALMAATSVERKLSLFTRNRSDWVRGPRLAAKTIVKPNRPRGSPQPHGITRGQSARPARDRLPENSNEEPPKKTLPSRWPELMPGSPATGPESPTRTRTSPLAESANSQPG